MKMELIALTNNGFENLASKEAEKLIKKKSKIYPSLVYLEADEKETIKLINHLQSARRILFSLGSCNDPSKLSFKDIKWKDILFPNVSLSIIIEGVKGQENRNVIVGQVVGQLLPSLEKEFSARIDFKKPDLNLIIFNTAEKYFLGIDLGGELNKRDYRLFPNSASFKGDLAYYLVRKSGFKKSEKLLVGFMKDGVLPIEAALFANDLAVNNRKKFPYLKLPLFSKVKYSVSKPKKPSIIDAFEESLPNFMAANKNSKLAGTSDFIKMMKCSIEDLDVKYKQNEFDKLMFHITSKDEAKINEIYYQANYLLKKNGRILLIGREQWDPGIPEGFKLVEKEKINRGENIFLIVIIEKI